MRRVLALGVLAAAVLAAVFVARADAIIGGTPDGNGHKGVGYVVFYDASMTPLWRCTGSLVSTRVVLTAGHCAGTYDNSTGVHTPTLAQVWFDKDIKSAGNYSGTGSCVGVKGWPCSGGDALGIPHAIETYSGSRADGTSHDLGVVTLFSAQNKNDVLPLAPLGALAATAPGTAMTIVGYGLQSYSGPERQRLQGTVAFQRVEDTQPGDELYFADFTNDAPGAAACNGDSGGPVLNAQGQIVAVMALVDGATDGGCLGNAFHYRTDTTEAQDFLAPFGVQLGGSGAPQHGHDGHKHGRGLNG